MLIYRDFNGHLALEGFAIHQPIRLAYTLRTSGPVFVVGARRPTENGTSALSDSELKQSIPQLHPLDVAIARELRAGTVFGQLAESQLARLLPLLAQRQTLVDGERLVVVEDPMFPRARVSHAGPEGIRVTVGLSSGADDWLDLSEGRLVAGAQAFFLRGAKAFRIESKEPWHLAAWARSDTIVLSASMPPSERDTWVKELGRAGVPSADLIQLAIRRGSARQYTLRLVAPPAEEAAAVGLDDIVLYAKLDADYGGVSAAVQGYRSSTSYLAVDGGLIERDLMGEESARHAMRELGFRFERETDLFVVKGDDAVRLLDPHGRQLPAHFKFESDVALPNFRRDLALSTRVQLLEDRGLLDLQVSVHDEATAGVAVDDTTVAELTSMHELLVWLQSGKKYMRLKDGSIVAPSPEFRRGLMALEDLGADAERVLVSPLCVGLLRALGDKEHVKAADALTRSWLEEIAEGAGPRPVDPPPELQGVLRDYQARGFEWLMMLHRHRLTGILADDMGLGKTLQALALLRMVADQEGRKPSLVVAPTSVIAVWRDECARFLPSFNVGLWYGPPTSRRAMDPRDLDVLVTSYGILRRDAEHLADVPFRYIILDEAQSAKNAASHNARAIRALKSERRLALTGTPVENNPEELWSVFDFLAPGFLGTMRQFRKRYARPIAKAEPMALDLLRTRVRPLILRRLKADVLRELPPRVESVVRCEMGQLQRIVYDHIAGELRESVAKKIEKVGIERAQIDILAAMTRLRQICCDPALLPLPEGSRVPPSAKLGLFEELMREALASSRRIVVFSQFVQMQKRLISVVRELGVEPLWLHGGTRNRDQVVANFQDPDGPPVIVVSLRAGGTGITLTRADTVMHYDPWWNPAVERQASDRAHRIGQKNKVTIYKLICARSIEERVLDLASRKVALAEGLLGGDMRDGLQISKEDVLALLE